MDEKTSPNIEKTVKRLPLGMSSFGPEERQQFGQNIRLAMACIEGKFEPDNKTSQCPQINQTILI